MFIMRAGEELTTAKLDKFIQHHKTNVLPRLEGLEKLYKPDDGYMVFNATANHTDIKIAHPYAAYITDINVGFFMGEPVKYDAYKQAGQEQGGESGQPADADELVAEVKRVGNYNDEASTNAALAEDASIFGWACELLYMDEGSHIRFKTISPKETIIIRDDTIEADILYAIRVYSRSGILDNNAKTEYADVYSRTEITHYTRTEGGNWASGADAEPHRFQQVPINPYPNNSRKIGDFESVIGLIKAYDSVQSNAVNEQEDFRNAYLKLLGMEDTENDEIAKMKKNRVLLLPEGGQADWLVKPQVDTALENLRKRIENDIHKLSKTPSFTDEHFAGNASGVAMEHKKLPLENNAAKKEREFRKGLQRRIELICEMLEPLRGKKYDFTQVNITFTRNAPQSLVEMANVVGKLSGLLSERTLISQLPLDVDPDTEAAQKRTEAEDGYSLPVPHEHSEG